jgi:hypothetical protein
MQGLPPPRVHNMELIAARGITTVGLHDWAFAEQPMKKACIIGAGLA